MSGGSYVVPSARAVFFDSSSNGFSATNVQTAIEELSVVSSGLKVFQTAAQVGTLTVSYTAGQAIFNGAIRTYAAGTLTVGANLTNFIIYAKNDGTVVVGASAFVSSDDGVILSLFVTDSTSVVANVDVRTSLNNNVTFGPVGDIATLTPDIAAAAGVQLRYARSDHVHNVPADVAVTVTTSSANAEGVAATFARSDHTHNVDITTSTASATADTTTASTTDGVMNSMTLTPAAGTYKVLFSTTVDQSNQVATVTATIYVGGVATANTARTVETRTNAVGAQSLPTMLVCHMNDAVVNGSQAIAINWKVSAGTGTAHIRRLDIERVA